MNASAINESPQALASVLAHELTHALQNRGNQRDCVSGEVEAFLSDIPKRAQRDQSVRGAGLAVSRRAIRTSGQPSTPGTIPPKPIG